VVAIVVSGPQATGKTTLALALGTALGIPVFSRDPLMQVLAQAGRPWPSGPRGRRVPVTGLRLQTGLLSRQLELGQSAILECVAPTHMRREWRQMTLAAGSRFVLVECTCGDATEHRARFERRDDGRSGPRSRGWREVTATIRRYRPDPGADFVADAMRPVAALVGDILAIAKITELPR
jgi:predicted kinase